MVTCDNLPPICIVALMLPLPMASKTVSFPMNTFLWEMRLYVVNHYCLNFMCCVTPKSIIQSYVV
jgi:hypothetical protein